MKHSTWLAHVFGLRALLSTVVLSATVLYGARAMAIDVFPGKEPAQIGLSNDDLILHRMSDEFYAESWYFMSRLQDGSQIFIHYGISNAGFGAFTGAIEATVVDVDGTVHFEKTTVKKDKIKYKEDVLNIDFDGDHTIVGDVNRFQITSHGEEIAFELTVTPIVPGLKFGDGATWFDDSRKEFYNLAILTPKGQMEGTVTVEGQKRQIKGYAYGDHSWQNYPAHKMADRLFSMRGFSAESSAAFLVFATAKFTIPTLVLTEGKNVVLATTAVDVVEGKHTQDEQIKKYQVPGELTLRNRKGGPEFSGKIAFDKRLMRQDPTDEFSFLERTAIKLFVAKPILYRHDNSFEFTVGGGDAPKTIQGKGVTETMILRAD